MNIDTVSLINEKISKLKNPLLIDSHIYEQLLRTNNDYIFKNSILLDKLWDFYRILKRVN